MAKRPPPYDEFYGQPCPYRLACPHLQGQNVETIASQTHHLREENHHLRQRGEQLVQQVHQLEARIAELQRRHRAQFKTGSTDDADAATGTDARPRCKRGAPKGHPAWTRPQPDRVDQIVPVPRPPACPHCHTPNLDAHPAPHTHRQEDIVLVLPAPSSPNTNTPNPGVRSAAGPSIKPGPTKCARPPSVRSPKPPPPGCATTSGFPIAKSSASSPNSLACASCPPPPWASITNSPAAPPASTPTCAPKSKSPKPCTPTKPTGAWTGRTISSGMPATRNSVAITSTAIAPARSRWTWWANPLPASCTPTITPPTTSSNPPTAKAAWPITSAPPKTSRPNSKTPRPNCVRRSRTRADFLQPLIRWIQRVCHARQQAAEAGQPATCLKPRCARWLQQLDQICRRPRPEPDVETFRQRLIKHRDRLLAFVEHPDGQPTNNAAEQALRPSVILRKITFGNRSAAGARNHSVITSLIQTAGKQSAAPRDVLEKLFCDQPNQAQAALYPNAPDTS
ncbi:MAG: transposase [Bacillus subtilis]|nr:transposase [Bacillus subtilis]